MLVFALTSMKDATEHCHYPELVGERLRVELNFTLQLSTHNPVRWMGHHWILIAKFLKQLFFANSLGRQNYSFLGKHYQLLIQQPLQVHPGVCGFYTNYAAFHLFKFGQKEITAVHDFNVLSIIRYFM